MDEVGLLRADCYVTNALHCRPVDNKIDKFLDCLETCRSLWLAPEIEAVSPAVIVLLGRVAAQPYFGKEPALAIRQLPDGGPLLIHAPHPSSINRQGGPEHAVGWPKLLQGLATAKRVGYGA
jgi:uracil-DNA glycosylase